MGVVVTMGIISEPPDVIGHHVGAALVGTFLGVLLAYGVIGPVASSLENQVILNNFTFKVVKEALVFLSILLTQKQLLSLQEELFHLMQDLHLAILKKSLNQ